MVNDFALEHFFGALKGKRKLTKMVTLKLSVI